MRPARGRPAASAAKRACVVRLEKIQQQAGRQDEAADDDRKKMTGPLKKRPVVMKKSPGTSSAGRQTRRRGATEDLSEYMLVTARAKRTPKPNPKYSNEDIVTPRMRGKEAMEESEVEEDDVYQSSEATEPQEETSEEEFEPSKPVTRGVVRLPNGEVVKRGPGRPPKNRGLVATPKPPAKRRLDTQNDGKDMEESILAQNKRLNIELYDASDSDISVVTPTTRKVGRPPGSGQSQRPVSRLAVKVQQAQFQPKDQSRRLVERRRVQQQPAQRIRASSEEDEDDPDEYETTGAASTVDDFETMPTFTIVNINDIINKKGDVMIQQTNRVNNNVSVTNNNNQSTADRGEDSRVSPNQASRNRRKSMHTTILSDKIDPEKLKNPPPRTPFPPRKQISPHSTLNHSLSKSQMNTNQSNAPRILNNVLCRRTKALQAKQEQLQEQKQQQQQQTQLHSQKVSESRPENPIQSKENHLNNFRSAPNATSPQNNATNQTSRKLPSSKVVIQRQGNKIVKKITCFETWYVINIPNIDVPPPKNHLNMTLMHLANTVEEVILPSMEWNFKVNLQKVNPNQIHNLEEVFGGPVQEANISDSEKHNYIPVSVMFRRASHDPKLRMPYDRAVIFKKENFYINIEGKNVRLLGSPQTITSHEDIEALLQIMNDVSLVSPFVEQVAYIL